MLCACRGDLRRRSLACRRTGSRPSAGPAAAGARSRAAGTSAPARPKPAPAKPAAKPAPAPVSQRRACGRHSRTSGPNLRLRSPVRAKKPAAKQKPAAPEPLRYLPIRDASIPTSGETAVVLAAAGFAPAAEDDGLGTVALAAVFWLGLAVVLLLSRTSRRSRSFHSRWERFSTSGATTSPWSASTWSRPPSSATSSSRRRNRLMRLRRRVLMAAAVAALAVSAIASADNIQIDGIDSRGRHGRARGQRLVIGWTIHETGGDGCSAEDGAPVVVTVSPLRPGDPPDSTLTFTSCESPQSVTFTVAGEQPPGDYPVTVSASDADERSAATRPRPSACRSRHLRPTRRRPS